MRFKWIEGSRTVAPEDPDQPMLLFLLEGSGQEISAPLAMPLLEPIDLVDARGILLEGALPMAVAPDELSVKIVRETFFEFDASDAHRRSAVNYLIHRLETCEPPCTDSLSERVLGWLGLNLDENINLDALCDRFACSKSGLRVAFKRAGLRSPMKELARLRIEEACALLGENELTVSQIARAVGYGDLAAFNHFFRRHAGCSPGGYRETRLWLT